jgi:hypothetical protein
MYDPGNRHKDGQPRPVGLTVSKGMTRRALGFLDALIKAIERVGGKVQVRGEYWKPEAVVSFCGEQAATFRLREKYKQQPHKPCPNESKWFAPKRDLIDTRRLVLDSGYCESVHCQDTEKGRRIEEAINELVIRWVEEAGRLRIARRQAEEKRRRREEEERVRREREAELQRRRQELHEKQRAEQAHVDHLLSEATVWRQSQTLHAYIREVERLALERSGTIAPESDLEVWLHWAHQLADRLDPESSVHPRRNDLRGNGLDPAREMPNSESRFMKASPGAGDCGSARGAGRGRFEGKVGPETPARRKRHSFRPTVMKALPS